MDSGIMNKDNSPSVDLIGLASPVTTVRTLHWVDVLVLVAGYIALDWVSFFHPLHGLNVTPWAPAPALGLVFILRYGWKAVLLIAFAIFLGDAWIRDLPIVVSALLAVLLAAGYGVIGEALRRKLRSEEVFVNRRGFFVWLLIVVAGTLVNSAIFISALVPFGLIPQADWSTAFIRQWIGDSVGILVTMPLIWMVFSERGRALLGLLAAKRETAALLVASAATLWIAFGLGADSHFKYLYVLFLPIIWAAARQGLSGVILIAAVLQAGIIFVVNQLDFSAISVLEIQMLTVVQATLGFFVGVVIDEQRRVSSELRQTLRLAAAGEMAGALAHELNQPLTALSAYAAACDKLLEQGDSQDKVRAAMRRIVAESQRAGEVVGRLRDFFRTGTTQLEPVALQALLNTSVASFEGRAAKESVRLTLGTVPDCLLLADRLQLEVVIRNLLSNAFDAVANAQDSARRVHVSAAMENPGRVCVQVEDSGPGLSATSAARLFEPFESTKSSGLGLGLVISRAIVHTHGGSLWAEVDDHGVFKLVLLVEGKVAHGNT
jgi:two-component system sensor kinase FixL